MTEVVVVIGAGSIGQAIARRVSAGKHVLLADLRPDNADAAAQVLRDAGFQVSTQTLDVSSRGSVQALAQSATTLGDVTGLIHAAGVSPSQASPETILAVDLYGTALVLDEFGEVIAPGAAGVVIASQSGHRLPALTPEQDRALATTPVDQLLALPMLQPDQMSDPLHAYQVSKRGNSLRVMAEAVRWGKRGARINTISPGIIFTPLARDELTGPRGDGYRRMIELSRLAAAAPPTKSATSAPCSWAPTGRSSPAATSSWTVASQPPTGTATWHPSSQHPRGSPTSLCVVHSHTPTASEAAGAVLTRWAPPRPCWARGRATAVSAFPGSPPHRGSRPRPPVDSLLSVPTEM